MRQYGTVSDICQETRGGDLQHLDTDGLASYDDSGEVVMSEADMLTLEEAEREYGLKRSTLYRWAKRGQVQVYRRPGDRKSYVQRAEVEKLREFRPRQTGARA
jgi:predicted DNA-binding transcriptional regulator AlpA